MPVTRSFTPLTACDVPALSPQWASCYMDFLQSLYDLSGSSNTYKSYHLHLRRFLSGITTSPELATKADVMAFIHAPSHSCHNYGKPVHAGGVNMRLAVIRSFYTFASEYSVASDTGQPHYLINGYNPTFGIRFGKQKRDYRALSESELRAFFRAIPRDTVQGKRDFALFLTLFYTCRRHREITSMCWGDIQEALFNEDGMMYRGHVYLWQGKGHATELDSQELPQPAYNAIIDYLTISGRLATIQPDEPIFIPTRMGRVGMLHESTVLHLVKRYAKVAHIPAHRICVHSFRHTGARIRYAQMAKPDVRKISRLLRHSNAAITIRYLEVLMGEADDGAGPLADKFADL